MDEAARVIAQLKEEMRLLQEQNAHLEAANAQHQHISEVLHMSEARFRLLVEQSPLSTQILSPDGWTVQVNRAWENLWGVTLEQMRDYNILHDPQLVAKGIMPYIHRAFAGEAVSIPPVLYNPDETLADRTRNAEPQRWVRAFIYPVIDRAGRLREVVLIHEDITERQHAEQALYESEARYRTLAENFPNGAVFLFDRDLCYTLASGTGLVDNGLSPDAFEGKTIWEIFPPEIAARDEPYLRAALQGEATRVEVTFGDRTHLVQTLPVKDEVGTIVGGMVMTQDITERKRAEEQLQFLAEASATLGASLDFDATVQSIVGLAVPQVADVCAIFIVKPDGSIQPVAARHRDPATAEQLGTHQQGLVLDSSGAHPVAVAIRTGQPVLRLRDLTDTTCDAVQHAAGQSTPVCIFVPPTHIIMPLTVREEVLGGIVFGWDDSDREHTSLERQLVTELAGRAAQALDHARLYGNAQEALRTRNEFLSIAAHELRTPLMTLSVSAEVLQRRAARTQPYTLIERDHRMLTVIMEQSRRLQHQIDMFLDLSQIETGHMSLNLEPLEVCSFIERVVREIQPTLERHQLTCSCEPAALVIQGDALRLDQVLQNLLQNAIKYSPDGGEITVRGMRRGNEVCIEVTDRGIGIPLEARDKLFERFYRAGNAARLGIRGLGIGLAVVTDIVARHGGRVEVASVEGEGSTFTVWLPHAREERDGGPSSRDV